MDGEVVRAVVIPAPKPPLYPIPSLTSNKDGSSFLYESSRKYSAGCHGGFNAWDIVVVPYLYVVRYSNRGRLIPVEIFEVFVESELA
jgi:hypothetical protein